MRGFLFNRFKFSQNEPVDLRRQARSTLKRGYFFLLNRGIRFDRNPHTP